MEYILIRQSLFVWINHGDELSVWRIKRSQLYICPYCHIYDFLHLNISWMFVHV